jgi:serine/threonine-protein kinase
MGEVYRATDTKLKRQVAIKILPSLLATDPGRVARFQREAELLASLNHPNIAAIYGLEDADGVHALVMELVEGDDLTERIAGPVPVDEVLLLAKQIADALEEAHERGIIHRDLKPANIKVRPDGTVKILDFGLAKLLEANGSTGPNAFRGPQSPTITSPAVMTGVGTILGTAAYMAPEQAKGRAADKRADIWAFGVVLFEMLTGERLFTGETVSDTLASVLKTEPDWGALPAAVPSRLRRLLRLCLDKDPKRRLRDIGDARVQIENLLTGAPEETDAAAMAGKGSVWQRALSWTLIAALGAALAAVFLLWEPRRQASRPAALRLSAELGSDASLTFGAGNAMTLSPDGDVLAFVAQPSGGVSAPRLYVRRLTEPQATALPGTDDAETPFFSPDGHWIAFFAGGKLKKVAVAGGAVVTLCDAPLPRGGAWGDDGMIVFLPDRLGSLVRVSSAGGRPEPLKAVSEGEVTQRWPQVLPDGKGVLFTGNTLANDAYNDASLVVQALPTGARTVVQRGGYYGRYVPSGHLTYLHDGTLFAAPFDLDRLVVTGPPVPVVEGVMSNVDTGGAQLAVSAGGTMVYLPGPSLGGGIPIHWMDHAGTMSPLRATRANWWNLRFAPDGSRLALQITDRQDDIWIYEWARDTLTRLTSHPAADTNPVWTPDGRRLVFASTRADKATANLYWQRADGTGDPQRLTASTNSQQPGSWHPSGKFLAFTELNPGTNADLMILPIEGDEASGWKPGKPTVFSNTPSSEREPMFSPDGRWIAYVSNEAGRDEVYVRPFPGPGGKWQISTSGAGTPTWSQTKRELFYGTTSTPYAQIMVAPFTAEGASFRAEKPRLWSEGGHLFRGPNRMFDLHPDGTRFAIAAPYLSQSDTKNHVTVITNFFEELRRVAPTGRR